MCRSISLDSMLLSKKLNTNVVYELAGLLQDTYFAATNRTLFTTHVILVVKILVNLSFFYS